MNYQSHSWAVQYSGLSGKHQMNCMVILHTYLFIYGFGIFCFSTFSSILIFFCSALISREPERERKHEPGAVRR